MPKIYSVQPTKELAEYYLPDLTKSIIKRSIYQVPLRIFNDQNAVNDFLNSIVENQNHVCCYLPYKDKYQEEKLTSLLNESEIIEEVGIFVLDEEPIMFYGEYESDEDQDESGDQDDSEEDEREEDKSDEDECEEDEIDIVRINKNEIEILKYP